MPLCLSRIEQRGYDSNRDRSLANVEENDRIEEADLAPLQGDHSIREQYGATVLEFVFPSFASNPHEHLLNVWPKYTSTVTSHLPFQRGTRRVNTGNPVLSGAGLYVIPRHVAVTEGVEESTSCWRRPVDPRRSSCAHRLAGWLARSR